MLAPNHLLRVSRKVREKSKVWVIVSNTTIECWRWIPLGLPAAITFTAENIPLFQTLLLSWPAWQRPRITQSIQALLFLYLYSRICWNVCKPVTSQSSVCNLSPQWSFMLSVGTALSCLSYLLYTFHLALSGCGFRSMSLAPTSTNWTPPGNVCRETSLASNYTRLKHYWVFLNTGDRRDQYPTQRLACNFSLAIKWKYKR